MPELSAEGDETTRIPPRDGSMQGKRDGQGRNRRTTDDADAEGTPPMGQHGGASGMSLLARLLTVLRFGGMMLCGTMLTYFLVRWKKKPYSKTV